MVKEKKVEHDIYCQGCHKTKKERNFYQSNSPKFDNDIYWKHTRLCKECIKDMIYMKGTNQINKEAFMKSLRDDFDMPFLNDKYLKAINSGEEIVGKYLKLLNLKNKKEKLTWADGETNEKNEKDIEKQIINNSNNQINKGELIELQNFWGTYNPEQCIKLQNFYDEFAGEYETDLPAQRLNFKNASKTQLQADEALTRNEVDLYNKLMKTLSTILGDSNVKPVQATGAEANDQVTFSTLLKKWENDKPVPKRIDDEMKKYLDIYIPGHIAKMEGLNNDLVRQYEESIKEYSVDFSENNLEDDE